MSARCPFFVYAGNNHKVRCTRPLDHAGDCRHIAARSRVPAMPAPRPLPVVRGPQLALAAVVSSRKRRAPVSRSKVDRARRAKLRESVVSEGTYRQLFVRCGKPACRSCKVKPSHGPYWYLEVTTGKRKATRYIGKRLPASVLAHVVEHGHPEAAAAAQAELLAAAEGGES